MELHRTSDELRAIEQMVHGYIPLARAMAVGVARADTAGLVLRAPLAPNHNHQNNGFAGSISSLATLACWTLVQVLLAGEEVTAVIQEGRIEYLAPVTGDFEACAPLPDEAIWADTRARLAAGRGARLTLTAVVQCGEVVAARFEGRFVIRPGQR